MVGRRSARAAAATSTATASKIKTSWRLLWIKPTPSPQRHRGTEKPEDTQACQKHPSPLDSFSAYHKPLVFLRVSVSLWWNRGARDRENTVGKAAFSILADHATPTHLRRTFACACAPGARHRSRRPAYHAHPPRRRLCRRG